MRVTRRFLSVAHSLLKSGAAKPMADAMASLPLSADDEGWYPGQTVTPTANRAKESAIQKHCATTQVSESVERRVKEVPRSTLQLIQVPAAKAVARAKAATVPLFIPSEPPYRFSFSFRTNGPDGQTILEAELKDGAVIARIGPWPGMRPWPVEVRQIAPALADWQRLCYSASRSKAWTWQPVFGAAHKDDAKLVWRFELIYPGPFVKSAGYDRFPFYGQSVKYPTRQFLQVFNAVQWLIGK